MRKPLRLAPVIVLVTTLLSLCGCGGAIDPQASGEEVHGRSAAHTSPMSGSRSASATHATTYAMPVGASAPFEE